MTSDPLRTPVPERWLWRRLRWFKWEAMWRLSLRTRDDRGQACRLNLEELARFSKTLPPPHDAAVFWSTIPRWFVAIVVALAFITVPGIIGVILCDAMRVESRWVLWLAAGAAMCMVPFVGTGVAAPLVRIWHAQGRCVRACREAKVCANCRYPLGGLPATDGFINCPECGHAWRMV